MSQRAAETADSKSESNSDSRPHSRLERRWESIREGVLLQRLAAPSKVKKGQERSSKVIELGPILDRFFAKYMEAPGAKSIL